MRIRRCIKTLTITILLTICFTTTCFCYDSITDLSYTDRVLLTDQSSWMYLTEQARYEYMLRYVPLINANLGIPENTFPAQYVHMMSTYDSNYNLACAYTDYNTQQIYVNIKRVNEYSEGGWAAVYALAHEMRHLYQDMYNTIPYNPESTIYNIDIYKADPREADANNYALSFVTYILNGVGVQGIGYK